MEGIAIVRLSLTYTMKMIDEIKSRIDIKQFIQKYIQLDKNDWALCPFHDEKTASFHVDARRQIFKCFGCNEGGDVIQFYQKYFKVETKTAIKELYEFIGGNAMGRSQKSQPKADQPLAEEVRSQKSEGGNQKSFIEAMNETEKECYYERLGIAGEKEAVYEARLNRLKMNREILAEFYAYCIAKGGNRYALNYLLKERKISESILNEKRIFTLGNYNEVSNHLKKCFSLKSLIECGLYNEAGNLIFYSHRILIPYLHKGRIVYLRGRYFDSDNNPVSKKFKYLGLKNDGLNINTPKRFYNRDVLAKMLPGEVIYITEGELDTAAVETMGWNACGVPGAGNIPKLKEMELLKGKKPVLCFDNDNAGSALSSSFAEILKRLRIEFYIKELPCKDANEFLINAA